MMAPEANRVCLPVPARTADAETGCHCPHKSAKHACLKKMDAAAAMAQGEPRAAAKLESHLSAWQSFRYITLPRIGEAIAGFFAGLFAALGTHSAMWWRARTWRFSPTRSIRAPGMSSPPEPSTTSARALRRRQYRTRISWRAWPKLRGSPVCRFGLSGAHAALHPHINLYKSCMVRTVSHQPAQNQRYPTNHQQHADHANQGVA